jgi:hypothetical protein
MKKVSLFMQLLLCAWLIFAEPVSFAEARQVAHNWVKILNSDFKDQVALIAGESLIRDGVVVGYVFHFAPVGYVLVAAEDFLPPVKLYSLKNDFGREGRDLEEQVIGNFSTLMRKVNAKALDPEKYFLKDNRDNFSFLKMERSPGQTLTTANPVQDVMPLLRTAWNQGDPYNLKCPTINGRKPPCGCVATAFAQIFYYFQYPASGQGSHSYNWRGTTLTAQFNHSYDWAQMLPNYQTTPGSSEQQNAVAQLMYDLGVAFEMDYALKGSGAYATDALTALPLFFKYSDKIKAIERSEVDGDEQWFDIARQQVDNGLPVAFSIYNDDSGHEVVIDGYRVSQGATTFHINMGWGGSYDGYYSLNNIIDFDINEWQIFVYDIYPPGYMAVLPPQNTSGEAFLNESLFFSQYYCRISWDASSSGDADLSKYIILQKDDQGNVASLSEVEPQIKEYTFRSVDYAARNYAVVAVDQNGRQSTAKYFSLVLR